MLNASKISKPPSAHTFPGSQLEDVTWDRHTFKLPMQLPNAANAHPSVKDRYYRATIEGVAASHQAPSLTKLNVLSSRFNFPHLIHEIDGSLQRLYDNTTGTDNHIIVTQLTHSFSSSAVLRYAMIKAPKSPCPILMLLTYPTMFAAAHVSTLFK
jgi:hypothetical protein